MRLPCSRMNHATRTVHARSHCSTAVAALVGAVPADPEVPRRRDRERVATGKHAWGSQLTGSCPSSSYSQAQLSLWRGRPAINTKALTQAGFSPSDIYGALVPWRVRCLSRALKHHPPSTETAGCHVCDPRRHPHCLLAARRRLPNALPRRQPARGCHQSLGAAARRLLRVCVHFFFWCVCVCALQCMHVCLCACTHECVCR